MHPTVLRAAERNYRTALRSHEPVVAGADRNFVSRRFHVTLDREKLRRLNQLLERVEQLLADDESADGEEHAVTIVVSPIR